MKIVSKALILAVFGLVLSRCQNRDLNSDTLSINPIIGNESWRVIFGKEPDET